MITITKKAPRFQPGQIVEHRRYAYRGVIVSTDLCCQADRDWYESNRTQPDRSQPWYHVLVDGASTTTYVAQENLREDTTGEPIHHPLLAAFFQGFSGGRYVRNDRPWAGGWPSSNEPE